MLFRHLRQRSLIGFHPLCFFVPVLGWYFSSIQPAGGARSELRRWRRPRGGVSAVRRASSRRLRPGSGPGSPPRPPAIGRWGRGRPESESGSRRRHRHRQPREGPAGSELRGRCGGAGRFGGDLGEVWGDLGAGALVAGVWGLRGGRLHAGNKRGVWGQACWGLAAGVLGQPQPSWHGSHAEHSSWCSPGPASRLASALPAALPWWVPFTLARASAPGAAGGAAFAASFIVSCAAVTGRSAHQGQEHGV